MSTWNKVEERTPKDGAMVLAYFREGGGTMSVALYAVEARNHWYHDLDNPSLIPSHWMALPSPPREETPDGS
jgi:hypothetical protein